MNRAITIALLCISLLLLGTPLSATENHQGSVKDQVYTELKEKGLIGLSVEPKASSPNRSSISSEQTTPQVPNETPPRLGVTDKAPSIDTARIESLSDSHWQPNGNNLQEIISVVLFFLTPVVIVWLIGHYSYKKQLVRKDCLRQILEEGKEVPETLFSGTINSPEQQMRLGIKLIGVGVGLLLFLSVLGGIALGSIGFIPLCLGLAQVLIWKIDSRNLPL